MNEQQNLTFHLGMSNVPSDIACDDNALEESLGMLFDKGEHRPIQTPVEFGEIDHSELLSPEYPVSNRYILFAHRYNNVTRYLVRLDYEAYVPGSEEPVGFSKIAVAEKEGNKIVVKEWLYNIRDNVWGPDENQIAFDYTDGIKIASLGKTIIISSGTGLNYFVWRAEGYTVPGYSRARPYSFMGNMIPMPKISFRMKGAEVTGDGFPATDSEYSYKGDVKPVGLQGTGDSVTVSDTGQEDWNNCAIGLYSQVKKGLAKKNLFRGSFCVRAALKLTTGSYYMISNPVFMLNTFKANCCAQIWDSKVTLVMYGQELEFKADFDYSEWSDLVKDVTLFVTKESELFDTGKDAICEHVSSNVSAKTEYYIQENKLKKNYVYYTWYVYSILQTNPLTDLKNCSTDGVYYRLCDIGAVKSNEWESTRKYMDGHVVENITTQDRLDKEDFYSHCPLFPNQLFVYNNRLSITDTMRGFFDGFTQFLPYEKNYNESTAATKTYVYYVTIKTDTGNYIIEKRFQSTDKQGLFFYYPDTRAKHVVLADVTTPDSPQFILDVDLKEHPSLNGAYYFYGITLNSGNTAIVLPTATQPSQWPITPSENAMEKLPNTLITSEVNEPFVFQANGYGNVGSGEIIGMTSNTQALSDGQHGQFPLLVFTTEGIWALSVTSEGIYADKDPISREVALEDNPCFTQTDNAVFFASKKGLMRVDGSRVTCVSEQMRGFADILKNAVIAYDYRQSLLHIASSKNAITGHYVYVYSLLDGTIARYIKTYPPFASVVSSYPDNLLCVPGKVYSLLEVPEESEDTNNGYAGELVSRPIKFGNGLTLKSLRDLKIIRDMQTNASVELTISASNDLRTWKVLKSFRGIPYKYFKIGLAFSGMKATDRFTGIAAIVQQRRTNKLR